jgi:hypothetical protein
VYVPKKDPVHNPTRRLPTRVRNKTKGLVPSLWARLLTKLALRKHCNLCKKHRGAYTTHNIKNCHRYKKDGMEKSNFRAAKKIKTNPIKYSFAQARRCSGSRKQSRNKMPHGRNLAIAIVIPMWNRVLGWVAEGK